ncbi:C40 family peptidase [Oceanomicrobium pacificus]|uniref:Peptidase n=1 Tax=Oceanomicrobium pacificus TaxID=2692916 RepID=A0A6B0TZ76_9RHOB|nr:peptidase [Oceanomicrobium pacificus]MXU66324.1 peptidase [Oceanomicrobium pacificus]
MGTFRDDAGARVVAAARDWIGTPYRHQSACKGAGTDCLGLVIGLWRELVGPLPVSVPAYTPDWDEVARRDRLRSAAERYLQRADGAVVRPGDVLLFAMRDGAVAKHLGIAAARDRVATLIHAHEPRGVVEVPLGPAWVRRVVARYRLPLEAN